MKEHPVTMNQAATLRVKWNQRMDRSPCSHLNLELEWDDHGQSTGNYVCILCGKSVAERKNSLRNIALSPITPTSCFNAEGSGH